MMDAVFVGWVEAATLQPRPDTWGRSACHVVGFRKGALPDLRVLLSFVAIAVKSQAGAAND